MTYDTWDAGNKRLTRLEAKLEEETRVREGIQSCTIYVVLCGDGHKHQGSVILFISWCDARQVLTHREIYCENETLCSAQKGNRVDRVRLSEATYGLLYLHKESSQRNIL